MIIDVIVACSTMYCSISNSSSSSSSSSIAVVAVVLLAEEVIIAVMLIFKLQQEEEGGRGNRDRGTAQKSQDLTVSELFQTVSDSILLSLALVKKALV